MAWVIGYGASQQTGNVTVDVAARREPPPSGFPLATETAMNNNAIMTMGLVGDLDGTAIAYASAANRLVVHGRLRLDLPPGQLAGLLRVPRESISDPRTPGQIDLNAELFRAQAGMLTQNGKAISRVLRARQVRSGERPSAVFARWVVRRYSFTLNRLKYPNEDEKVVMSAIVLSAGEMMPKPGDGVRAVAVDGSELEDGRVALTGGMLPLEREDVWDSQGTRP
jgi:hypothetical protein